MPSIFTETTELMVGFGILGSLPTEVEFEGIKDYFNNALSRSTFEGIASEFEK